MLSDDNTVPPTDRRDPAYTHPPPSNIPNVLAWAVSQQNGGFFPAKATGKVLLQIIGTDGKRTYRTNPQKFRVPETHFIHPIRRRKIR